jgi:2-hydroxychromene-2-carboxylate isomerase
MKTFEFWFDFGSPASYLASTQIAGIESATGARAVWRPMLLGGVFQATGNHSPATIPAKGRYTFVDFDRFARRYGVPLTVQPPLSRSTPCC